MSRHPTIPELRDAVLFASDALSEARRKYLEACGWKHTSETPGCCWLWTREIDGIHWGVPVERALMMQQAIDTQ